MKKQSTRQINRAIKQIIRDSLKEEFDAILFNFNAEPWREEDKKWFAAKPRRSFRIRRIYVNELPKEFDSGETHVIVRQITPSIRDKVFLKDMKGGASYDALPDVDSVGMILWKKFHDGADAISLNDVVSEARMVDLLNKKNCSE
ncbi:hypothetical protein [Nitrosomonas sp.]|uniref:hypothetical protein n=1 Tax=Nitrosomonas sp. TaxID=42353 RepID=UPI00260EBFBC|nr:hypothetical protein [Nitrosomonas sp.]MCW5600166.1 hypothetical protein [Nitrosomonas sp.]